MWPSEPALIPVKSSASFVLNCLTNQGSRFAYVHKTAAFVFQDTELSPHAVRVQSKDNSYVQHVAFIRLGDHEYLVLATTTSVQVLIFSEFPARDSHCLSQVWETMRPTPELLFTLDAPKDCPAKDGSQSYSWMARFGFSLDWSAASEPFAFKCVGAAPGGSPSKTFYIGTSFCLGFLGVILGIPFVRQEARRVCCLRSARPDQGALPLLANSRCTLPPSTLSLHCPRSPEQFVAVCLFFVTDPFDTGNRYCAERR
jgi:hypothetical protein